MAIQFYPSEDDLKGSLEERIEILMGAAEEYKATVLDTTLKENHENAKKPSDLAHAYNWAEIAAVLRETRDMPEGSRSDKDKKGALLIKISDIYEVLRGAKMAKLEAVRLALLNEARQLGITKTETSV